MWLSGAAVRGLATYSPVALVPCLLLLLALAGPAAAAPDYSHVNTVVCPSGTNITYLDASKLGEADLYLVFANINKGVGKTYVLQPGAYTMSGQIRIDGNGGGAPDSTTCFIGAGDTRGDVVITATFDTNQYAFLVSSSGATVNLGLKGLILDNGANAQGVLGAGATAGWSLEDITIRNGVEALFSSSPARAELANVAVEHIQGVSAVYHASTSPIPFQWSDLSITDCTTTNFPALAFDHGVRISIAGRMLLARNRAQAYGGGALDVKGAEVTFTGNVTMEGNEFNTAGASGPRGGGAAFLEGESVVRFTETSSLLVKDNYAHNSDGGGFLVQAATTVSILGDARFVGNTADGNGGAVLIVDTSSQIEFGNVCFTQNTARGAGGGAGIYIQNNAAVTFTSPAGAVMGDNTPADSSIAAQAFSTASWTCSDAGAPRGPGVYSIQGPLCACTAPAVPGGASTCACPAATPVFDPESCTCVECLPGSGPCCSATAEFVPCTRSVTFVPDTIASPFCEDVELLVVVTDTAPAGSSPLGQPAETAPAVDVPVVFGVSGDCEPSVQARTVRTYAQGRARVRVTAQGPGVAAVTAAVTSGGSLPRKAVLATSHIKFLPCGHGRGHAYDDDDEHDGYARRPGYEHTRTARPYAADDDDVAAEAFEAMATQMALQAMGKREAARRRP